MNKQKKDDATIKALRDKVARLEFFETQATAYEDSNREAVDRADKLSAKNKALQKEVDAYKEEGKLSAKKIKNTTELEAEIARLKSHCMKYKTNVCVPTLLSSAITQFCVHPIGNSPQSAGQKPRATHRGLAVSKIEPHNGGFSADR